VILPTTLIVLFQIVATSQDVWLPLVARFRSVVSDHLLFDRSLHWRFSRFSWGGYPIVLHLYHGFRRRATPCLRTVPPFGPGFGIAQNVCLATTQ
jgi:hypothetical protein